MKQAFYLSVVSFLFVFAVQSCKNEGDEFTKDPIINFNVVDDSSKIVSGARISVYENEVDFSNAVATKNYSVNQITTTLSDNNGNASLILEPGKEYYILISYYNNDRFLNLSNISTGGYFDARDLTQGQTLSLTVIIIPDDGNIIFYTTNTNKIPIAISLTETANTNAELYTLSGIYGIGNTPSPQNANTVSVYKAPGTYRYYAKSQDGCVWSDTVFVNKGTIRLVNLSKCESGTLSFYTTSINDTLLPISIKLNAIDSIGNIVLSRAPFSCAEVNTNALTVTKYKGLYSYFAKSRSGRCVWTGSIFLASDDCVIVPIDICD
ncbi:MAG: hypothetical protein ACKVOU_08640 [Cytophagales bacterium]